MAIAIGNASNQNPTPGASTYTYSTHNQNTGADGFLYLEVCISATYTISSATWNGVSMTLHDTNLSGNPPNLRLYRYYLASPATGTNDLVLTFNTSYVTSLGFYLQSFTGCSGISDSAFTGLTNSPHNDTMSVSAGDVLFGSGMSLYTISIVNIDGTDYFSPNFTANGSVEGDRWTGQISGVLSAGTSNSEMDAGAPSFQTTNHWVLFGEASGGGGGRRRIIIV
jgi:hypothetical protein